MAKCTACETEFKIYPEDEIFYTKFAVPAPTHCPQCRLIRRLCERNTRNLYWRKCGLTGKKTLSSYSEHNPFPVYSVDAWWSDKWDAMDFGRDFDFNRPFFEQFAELKAKVPHMALYTIGGTLQNSEYTNCTGYLKNCYMIFESDYDEDCYYSNLLKRSKNMVDCSMCYDSELCYECINCTGGYNLKYSQDCTQCINSAFLFNCQSCENCIGCINQRHKKYMIFNKQYTKEGYEELLKKANFSTHDGIAKMAEYCKKFWEKEPHKNLHAERNENSLGDHLYNSKNAFNCFDSKDLEDCRYCARLSLGVKSSIDYNSWGSNAELVYESSSCGDHIYNLKFCTTCTTNLADCTYCDQCTGSRDLFGCIGLKKKQYCILNKQYTKKEYENLLPKIIHHMGGSSASTRREAELKNKEWGEFFPPSMCAYGYNETIAMDYFPMTKEEATKKGFKWAETGDREIKPTADDAQKCVSCEKLFRLIPQELEFYKNFGVAIPEKCYNCRHSARMRKVNPYQLFQRKCAKCGDQMSTTYAPERPEVVYCNKCYTDAVYG